MPSKAQATAESSEEPGAAFDAWWDKRGLSDLDSGHPLYSPKNHGDRDYRPHPLYRPCKLGHPLHRPYRKLYGRGADLGNLDVIDKLVCCFMDHNAFSEPNVPFFSTNLETSRLVHIKLKVATDAGLRAAMERPDLFRNESDRRDFCEEIADCLNALRPKAPKIDKAARLKEIKQLTGSLRSRGADEHAIALFEFSLIAEAANCHQRGKRADLWGTLFLVALTTYLTGSVGKPHHAIANQILRTVREGNAAKSLDSVRSRISKFTKQYPDWLSALKGLILYPCVN